MFMVLSSLTPNGFDGHWIIGLTTTVYLNYL